MGRRKNDNRCIQCTREFEQSQYKGRPRLFCKSPCMDQWHVEHPEEKSVYEYLKKLKSLNSM